MSATAPPVVELRHVRLRFDEKLVLDDVCLEVEPLERVVIMGQSGSGKSTVLRLILGILPPTSGSIFFKQFEISRLPRRKLQRVRSEIGMLYQGKIIESGPPEQLKQSKNPVVAQFLSGSTEGPILEGTQDAIATK